MIRTTRIAFLLLTLAASAAFADNSTRPSPGASQQNPAPQGAAANQARPTGSGNAPREERREQRREERRMDRREDRREERREERRHERREHREEGRDRMQRR